MRKVKVLHSYSSSSVDDEVQEWLEKNKRINIISITGSANKDYFLTYILYEDNITAADLLKS